MKNKLNQPDVEKLTSQELQNLIDEYCLTPQNIREILVVGQMFRNSITIEEIKKEWEDDQWFWSYDEKANTIHLWRKYYYVTDHIDINLKYKEIEINFSKLTIDLLELLTKTFKALGWEV